jgi:hypothetical protein
MEVAVVPARHWSVFSTSAKSWRLGNSSSASRLLQPDLQLPTFAISATMYARWVPPRPATQNKASASPQPASDSPRSSHKKKDKKSKKRVEEPVQHIEPNVPQITPNSVAGAESTDSPRSTKEPKKRKRESIHEEDAATPKKHKSILSKFEKVSRKAQEHVQQHDGEAEPEQEMEPEVLRGASHNPQMVLVCKRLTQSRSGTFTTTCACPRSSL